MPSSGLHPAALDGFTSVRSRVTHGLAAIGSALARDVVVTNDRLDGISAGPGSTVSGNTTSDNDSDGNHVGDAVFGNIGGTAQGGVFTGGHGCKGAAACP